MPSIVLCVLQILMPIINTLLIASFYWWKKIKNKKPEAERLSYLFKVTQFASGRVRIWTQVFWLWFTFSSNVFSSLSHDDERMEYTSALATLNALFNTTGVIQALIVIRVMLINILTFIYKAESKNQLERNFYMMRKLWYMSIFILTENTTDVPHLGKSNDSRIQR